MTTYGFFTRITRPYNDVSGIIHEWSKKVGAILCCEHPADGKVKKIHVHLLIDDSPVKEEALKRIANGVEFGLHLSGNQDWSWKKLDWEKEPIKYMIKGKYAPKFNKNIPEDLLESSRLAWVEPKLGNDKSPASSKIEKLDELDIMEKDYHEEHDIKNVVVSLDLVRTWTMRWYWKRYNKLPIVSNYKRNAGSLYLRLVECRENTTGQGSFSCAMEEIKDLWY